MPAPVITATCVRPRSRRFFVYADPQSFETIESAPAIRRRRIAADFAPPSGQRRQNGIAMRDRFISRYFNDSGDRTGRFDRFLSHDGILTCSLMRSPNSTARLHQNEAESISVGNHKKALCAFQITRLAGNLSQPGRLRITKDL